MRTTSDALILALLLGRASASQASKTDELWDKASAL
jgi:hypothetical protein